MMQDMFELGSSEKFFVIELSLHMVVMGRRFGELYALAECIDSYHNFNLHCVILVYQSPARVDCHHSVSRSQSFLAKLTMTIFYPLGRLSVPNQPTQPIIDRENRHHNALWGIATYGPISYSEARTAKVACPLSLYQLPVLVKKIPSGAKGYVNEIIKVHSQAITHTPSCDDQCASLSAMCHVMRSLIHGQI